MAEPVILIARTSFSTRVDGTDYHVRDGNTIMSDHPLARAHPDMFRKAADAVTFRTPGSIESATAAPGEKRNR